MSQTPGSDDDGYRAGPYDEGLPLAEYEQPMLDLGLEQPAVRREGPHDVA